jgi:hypothetical protein
MTVANRTANRARQMGASKRDVRQSGNGSNETGWP